MKVVILAGGLGTRISEESHLRPKPMIEIGEKPILWHIMKYYSHFGFHEFIICAGYKGNMIKEYFANYYLYGSDITFDFTNNGEIVIHNNESEPWKVTVIDTGLYTQTGGRINRIKQYVGENHFMITYGDGVSNVDLNALLNIHKQRNNVVTLTTVQPGGRFGVLDLDKTTNRVAGFREKSVEDTGWINAGFMVASPEVFEYLGRDEMSFEQEALVKITEENKLGFFKHFGYWQCMDTQRDKYFLEQHIKNNTAPWMVW